MFAMAECDSVTFSGSVNTSRHDPILWDENTPARFTQFHCEATSQIVTITLLKWTRNARINFCGCISNIITSWYFIWDFEFHYQKAQKVPGSLCWPISITQWVSFTHVQCCYWPVKWVFTGQLVSQLNSRIFAMVSRVHSVLIGTCITKYGIYMQPQILFIYFGSTSFQI